MEAITEDTYSRRTQFRMIDYDTSHGIQFDGHMDYLKLLESSHMLGSSQVLVVTHDGLRILYSGDISPQDRPPKCDVLAIDSTHGNPNLDKKIDSGSMERRLIDAVMENIASQKPVCIHAHRGKLQHLMHLLSEHGEMPDDVSFLASKIDIRVAKIYRKYNYGIRDLVDLHEYEGEEITTGDLPWIEFTASMGHTPRERKGRVSRIAVSGSYGSVVMQQDSKNIWVASDEHAEFTDILKYVKAAEPRAVVTDGSRTSNGLTLANAIKSDLGIESRHMPS